MWEGGRHVVVENKEVVACGEGTFILFVFHKLNTSFRSVLAVFSWMFAGSKDLAAFIMTSNCPHNTK